MSFKEAAEKYRTDMHACIKRGDTSGGRVNAIAYASVLRRAADKVGSYTDRAFLVREADKYEYIAALITKWGVCDALYTALADPAPHLKKLAKDTPSAASVGGGARGRASAKGSQPSSTDAEPTPPTPKAPKAPSSDLFGSLFSDDKPNGASVKLETPLAPGGTHGGGQAEPTCAAPSAPTAPFAPPAPGVEWIADTMERCIESVWIVNTTHGRGTGFFISEDGFFLTNRHVVYNCNAREGNIWIVSHDDKKQYKAIIKHVDKEYDVALLQIIGMPCKAVPLPLLRDFSTVRAGCDMMIIGNGLDYGLAPITGTIKYPKDKANGDMVYTALTNNGDSGSPVLNRSGYVIGIHKSSTSAKIIGDHRIEARGISNATPVCNILDLLKKWSVEI